MILTREQVVKKARNLYEQVIAAMAGDTPPYRDEGESIARFNFIEGYCAGHEDALAAAIERYDEAVRLIAEAEEILDFDANANVKERLRAFLAAEPEKKP